jgi:hypothetical protein
MKRSEHACAVESCGNACPRAYPFCADCWRRVPKELRAPVRKELATRSTTDLDRSALYAAVRAAAASVKETAAGPAAQFWEVVYHDAGSPCIDERVYGLL